MANVYKNELYGSLLPNVYIEKITLENSGFLLESRDPHLQPRSTVNITQRNESSPVKITLNLLIKQEYKNNIVSKWLEENDFQKYLKVKVIQIKDARITSLLNLSKDVATAIDPNTRSKTKPAVANLMSRILGAPLSSPEMEDLLREKTKITFLELTNPNSSALKSEQTTIETLDDGTTIINIHISCNYIEDAGNLGHLSYCCVSYLDEEKLIEDFELEDTENFSQFIMNLTKVSSEIVFDNFSVKNQSFVFLDSDSKIWPGDVNKDEDGQYYSGIEKTEDSILLFRRTVSNSTIQDFRRRKEVQQRSIQTLNANKYFEKFEKINSNTDTSFLARKNSYFSPLQLTTDSRRKSAVLTFSLDAKSMIIDSSKYSYLVDRYDSTLANEITRTYSIKSIKMYRQRVKEQNVNNNSFTVGKKYIKFSKDEKREKLFHSKFDKGTVVDDRKFYLKTLDNELGVLSFTAKDKTTSKISDGLYQYSIEIEIEDPFVKFIQSKIEALSNAKLELQKYLVEAERPSITRNYLDGSNPHLRSLTTEQMQNSVLEGSFNHFTNSFNESFYTRMREIYGISDSPWVKSVSVYVTILSIFFSLTTEEKEQLSKDLVKMASPITGSPNSIYQVIKVIEQLESNLMKILGIRTFPDGLSQKTQKTKNISTYEIFHVFEDKVFDANLESGLTIDYFGQNEVNDTENFSLSVDDYAKIVRRETEKYFTTDTPSTANLLGIQEGDSIESFARNSYSYLTPSLLKIRDVVIDASPTNEEEKIARINNAIALAKTGDDKLGASLKEETAAESMFNSAIQQKYSVVFSMFSIDKPETRRKPPEPEVRKEKVIEEPKERILEKMSEFSSKEIISTKKMSKEDRRGISNLISTLTPFADTRPKVLDRNSAKGAINAGLTDKEKERIPNQIKAILADNSNTEVNSRKLPEKTLKDLPYARNQETLGVGSIKEVQILTGYKTGEKGQPLMNQPVWEKATQEKVAAIPANVEVICRLNDFTQQEAKAEDITKISNVANQTFTLIGNAPVPERTNQLPSQLETSLNNVATTIEKEVFEAATKVMLEQEQFPPALITTNVVGQNNIERAIQRPAVTQEVSTVQSEKASTSKTTPKVPSQKTSAGANVKKPNVPKR